MINCKTSCLPKKGASYILTDGNFLNLLDNKELFPSLKEIRHRDLDSVIQGVECPEITRSLKFSENAVAINDGSNFVWENAYVDLPPSPITNEQYNSILKYLDYLMSVSSIVEVGFGRPNFKKYDFASLENDNGYLPEDIIKEIKKQYKNPV